MRHLFLTSKILRTTVIAGAIAIASAATAQINSADAEGYLARARSMYAEGNFTGCIDQLSQARLLTASPASEQQIHYYLALATLHSGDDEAIDLLTSFVAQYPEAIETYEIRAAVGDYYFTRGNYPDALKAYAAATPSALDDVRRDDCIYREAYCRMMLGEDENATALFDRLTGSRRYSQAAAFYKAYIDYTHGRYDEALAGFTALDPVAGMPGCTAPYYIAQIHFSRSQYEQALEWARRALEQACGTDDSRRAEASRIAGESLFNLGKTTEATPYLATYVELCDSPVPSAYYMMGVGNYNAANYPAAADDFRRAAESEGVMAQSACLYLGQCYVNLDKTSAALLAFEKAYRMGYDNSITETAFYNYIVARLDGGRLPFSNSVEMLETFLSRFPDSYYASAVEQRLVDCYMTEHDYEGALRSINRVKNPSPQLIAAKQQILFTMGTREYTSARPAEALALLEEACDIDPNSSVGRQCTLWIGNCLYDKGDYARAARQFLSYAQSAEADDPNAAVAWYDLGYARFMDDDFGAALKDFDRVIDSGASSDMRADAACRAADCLYYTSDFDAAANYYQKAVEMKSSSADYALFQLAVMRGLQRDYRGKISRLDRMMQQYPTSSWVPAAMLEKAETYVTLGDESRALEQYDQLVNRYPSTSYGRRGMLQMAITYAGAGDVSRAKSAYRDVIKSYPTSEEAHVAIDDLKRIYAEEGRLRELADFVNSVPNAPRIETSALDDMAYESALNSWTDSRNVNGMLNYINQFPDGAHEAQALWYLAQAASEGGDTARALDYASRIVTRHPDSEVAEDAMLVKAQSEEKQGKLELALKTYMILESRASGGRIMDAARTGIMHTAMELGRYDDVLDVTGRLLSSSTSLTDPAEVHFAHAKATAATGHSDAAIAEWRAQATNPVSLYGSMSAVHASQALLDAGRTDEAIDEINKFINANPPHQYWLARGFIVLSDGLRLKGESFEADEYLRSLRENYPGTEKDIFEMIDHRLGSK